jgi:integrase
MAGGVVAKKRRAKKQTASSKGHRIGKVRVYQEKGREGFWIRWTDPKTGQHKLKVGTEAEADALAMKTHEGLQARKAGLMVADDPHMDLRDLLSDYSRWKSRHGISKREVCAIENEITRAFDVMDLTEFQDVDRRTVERFIDHLQDRGLAARTQNKYLDKLKGLFKWAEIEGRVSSSPVRGLKPRKGDAKRVRQVFSSEQMAAILKGAKDGPPWQLLAIMLGYYAAMRLREVKGLQWGRVLWDSHKIHLRACDQKGKRKSWIPICPILFRMLETAKQQAGDVDEGELVLPGMPKDPSRYQRALLGRLGIPYKNSLGEVGDFHAYRHTCLTDMANSGMPLVSVKDFARHKKPETTMGYVRENDKGMMDAAMSLPEHDVG